MSRVYHTQKEIGSGCKVKGMVVKKKGMVVERKRLLGLQEFVAVVLSPQDEGDRYSKKKKKKKKTETATDS